MSGPIIQGIPVATDLLRVVEMQSSQPRTGQIPLMLEFAVNRETAPFLVSSTRSVLWITPRVNKVRAAVRHMPERADFFREVVDAVAEVGAMAEWGNVHPFTAEGYQAALDHLKSYEILMVEVLAAEDADVGSVGTLVVEEDGRERLSGVPLERASWLPKGHLVVVPQNREFLGTLMLIGEWGVSVVHNASRGMAVLRTTP